VFEKFILGIISRGINAIIRIGSLLPYVFLRNFGCQKDKIASRYPENTEKEDLIQTAPKSTIREQIKPAEIQDLIHTGNCSNIYIFKYLPKVSKN